MKPALLLHRIEENLPEEQRLILEELHKDESGVGRPKRYSSFDDDIRNIFRDLPAFLERYNMGCHLR